MPLLHQLRLFLGDLVALWDLWDLLALWDLLDQ